MNPPREERSRGRWPRIGVAMALLVVLVLLGRELGADLPGLGQRVVDRGLIGLLVFVAAYAVATVAFVPGWLLTLTAGALFGIARGTVIVLAAATVGSCLAFLLARYVARDAVQRRLADHPKFEAVDRAVGRHGFKVVLLLRLSPLFPFNALNYALGLTRVRFRDYLLASIGMLPGTLLYVYYGQLAGSAAAIAGGSRRIEHGWGYYGFLGLGLLATILAVAVITRAAGRALDDVSSDRN